MPKKHSEVSQAVVDLYKRELAQRNLKDFCQRMDPNYMAARHADALIHNLEALERRDIDRLMVFMPPRHSKTYHCSERFPAWFQGKSKGRAQIILTSYAAERAQDSSRKCRDLYVESTWPWLGEITLKDDSTAVARWHTNKGGVLMAAGVGGGITGFGAHLLVIDDPLKDRAEAESPTRRQEIWDWYTDVAKTRLMPNAVQLLMMTRWHDDDLAGRILNAPGAFRWTILSLPALAIEPGPHDPPDLLGRQPGQALWPAFMNEAAIADMRETMSSASFSAMYQQNPVPAEGAIFKAEWFNNRYDQSELYDKEGRAKQLLVIQSIDSAWKTGVKNDFSVIATWGYDGKDIYLLDVWRAKVEYWDLRRIVVETYNKFTPRPQVIYCEDTAAGLALVGELKRSTSLPIVSVPVGNEKKEPRAERVTSLFETNRVRLPKDAPWLSAWIEEHLRFPSGSHDDQVDTTSIGLGKLLKVRQHQKDDSFLYGWMAR